MNCNSSCGSEGSQNGCQKWCMKKCLFATLAVVAAFLALYVLLISIKEVMTLATFGRDIPAQSVIFVSGHGEEVAIPDIATFSFSVVESAKTLDAARTQATTKNNAALAVLSKNGVTEKDIKTTAYNVYPKYEYQQGVPCVVVGCPSKQVLVGYEVSQTTEVKVRDTSKVGALFTAVTATGVSNVDSLQFTVDKRDALTDSARLKAIDDAKARAKDIAAKLGVKLVRVTSYSDNSPAYPVPMYYAKASLMSASDAAVSPEVSVGQQKITSDVTLNYEVR